MTHETPFRFPDFYIIGAAKSGTTWLTICLRRHPNIFMPLGEPHFFSQEFDAPKRYMKFFETAMPDQLVGENSNSYLLSALACERLHAVAPTARLIVSLREPTDRAYADYCMWLRSGTASNEIKHYLDPKLSKARVLVDAGLYYTQLKPYIERFGMERIHIVPFTDIRQHPEKVISSLCEFLNLNPEFAGQMNPGKAINAKSSPELPPSLKAALGSSQIVQGISRRLKTMPRLHSLIKRAIGVQLKYPELPDEMRQSLADFYQEDTKKLTKLLGRSPF